MLDVYRNISLFKKIGFKYSPMSVLNMLKTKNPAIFSKIMEIHFPVKLMVTFSCGVLVSILDWNNFKWRDFVLRESVWLKKKNSNVGENQNNS